MDELRMGETKLTSVKEKQKIAIKRWQLSDVTEIYTLPKRGVYSAKSLKYGNVILKISHSLSSIAREYQMLKAIDGKCACRVYEFDSDEGILLEEKIIPGTVLREEADVDTRIQKFVDTFRKIHKEPSGVFFYPTYFEWIHNARATIEKLEQGKTIIGQIKRSEEICRKLFDKYAERMILHGDLHHDNMLLSEDGSYRIIDAKGVLAPQIFDIPRFILNETDEKLNKAGKEHILYVIGKISELLSYPVMELRELFYMETALANAWNLDGGEDIDLETMRLAEEIVRFPVETE